VARYQPVTIDADFTENERDQIKAAFSEWNLALNGYDYFGIREDAADFPMLEDALKDVQATGQGRLVIRLGDNLSCDDGTLAFVTDLGSPVIYVCSLAVGERNLKAIMMHEIGHTLGMNHIGIVGTLMFPGYTFGAPCIDDVTIRALASIRPAWRYDHLRSCGWAPPR
jgi:hypothetical protein